MAVCLLALAAAAQTAPPQDKVLAKVDGENITTAKLRELLIGAPPAALNIVKTDPKEFFTWTYLMDKLSKDAESKGLHKKSPYSDRVDWNHDQVLMMARIEDVSRGYTLTETEADAWYDANRHLYGTARTRLIFVAAEAGNEAKSKARIDAAAAEAAKGADFAALVKKYSEDQESAAKGGEFAPIGPESRLPVEIRKTIFATQPGKTTPVIRQPAGFYLFQVVGIDLKPMAEVRPSIQNELRQSRSAKWMEEQKKSVEVKILNQPFFDNLPKLAGPVVSQKKDTVEIDIKPETELAIINGVVLTAEHFTGILKAVSPQVRTKAVLSALEFLKDYGLMRRLVESAEKAGLHQKQPFKNRLWYDRNMALMQARVDDYLNRIVIAADEQRKAFDDNPDRFKTAQTRVIYIAYSLTPPPRTDPNAPKILNEDEARQKAESILAEHKKGADFVGLVTRFSEDPKSRAEQGVLPPIAPSDGRVPEEIRNAVFKAKKGDVVGPIRLPNGFYLFRVEDIATKKYEEVKDQILEELRQERFQAWFSEQQGSIRVEIADADGIRLAASRP